ncbi:hypothetical protein C2U68_17530 [Methylomonas koyamae]|nr:hypothetical protein C2U68_17530 [Methylomonas koyamae]
MPNSKILSLSLLMAAFGAGYCVRGIDFSDAASLANQSASQPTTPRPLAANRKSEQSGKTSRLAASASGIRLSEQAVNRGAAVSRTQALPMAETEAAPRDTHELLGALDAKLAQNPDMDALRNSPEFQQLIAHLQSDPAARNQVISQFLHASGTDLGNTLSEILAMSGGVEVMPELKDAASQLLRDGNDEQRLNALQLIGGAAGNDPKLRSQVIDMLHKVADSDPRLASAAISSLNRQGVSTRTEHQDVIRAVSPLAASADPEVRRNSLQVLTQWTGKDQSTLEIFTKAARDSDTGVRSLAVSALGNGSFSYENVRDSLLAVLQNPSEDLKVQAAAQQALSSFPLDEQALKIYQEYMASVKTEGGSASGAFN